MKLSMISEMREFLPNECQFKFGECGLEVYQMTKRALAKGTSDFIVVDSVVDVNGDIVPHSWIERDGEIIDPTVNQFRGNVKYSPPEEFREEFSPQEYIDQFEEQYGEM